LGAPGGGCGVIGGGGGSRGETADQRLALGPALSRNMEKN